MGRAELVRAGLQSAGLRLAELGQLGGPDPLSALDDDFSSGPSDPLLRGWSLFNAGVVSVANVSPPWLTLEPTGGGPGGSFWFDAFTGFLLYKAITGPFQAYARIVVQNAAGTGGPPLTDFRIGGIAAHDPARPPNNYVHMGAGSGNLASYQAEPKTTDNSFSAYTFSAIGTTSIDVCIRRFATNVQLLDLRYRLTGSQPLLSGIGWTTAEVVDRNNAAIPPRPLAVPLPLTLWVGLMCYSNLAASDVRILSSQWAVRSIGV